MRLSEAIVVIVLAGASLVTASATGSTSGFGGGGTSLQAATDSAVVSASSVPGQVRFAAAGDFAYGPSTTGPVLQAIAAADPDAVLALGDLSYGDTGQESAWCDFVTARVGKGVPFELLAGNHESNGLNGNIEDFSACLPNQLPGLVGTYGRQYYVDVPADQPLVRFVMISPALDFPGGAWTYAAGSPRYDWTADVLDDAHRKAIPWVVAGVHKPCLSMGRYPCDIGTDLVDLLMAKQVDAVLMGHEHNYQRTKQLDLRPGCTSLSVGAFDPDCVADADGDLTAGNGTVFHVLGTGGAVERDTYPGDPEAGYFAATAGMAAAPEFGFGDFTATATRLSTRFVSTSSGFTDGYTLTKPVDPSPNAAPRAAFTSTGSGLTTAFTGASSTDADGAVVLYQWDFGDGARAAGPAPTHAYAAPGTYDVTLTVTDDRGATAAATRQVTATRQVAGVLAADTFGRAVADGLGSAETGGPWVTTPTVGAWSVAGGTGVLRLSTAGAKPAPAAYLGNVVTRALDLRLGLALSARPTGGRVDQTVVLRRRGADAYRAAVRVTGTGGVQVSLARTVGGAATTLVPVTTVPGVSLAAGDRLLVRAQATGTSPTTLRLKAWRAGTAEPSAWAVSTTDAAAALQGPGYAGLTTALTSGVTNAPIQVRYDDLLVATAGSVPSRSAGGQRRASNERGPRAGWGADRRPTSTVSQSSATMSSGSAA